MAFAQQFMLMNVGDAGSVTLLIAVLLVENLLFRCFTVDIDRYFFKKLNLYRSEENGTKDEQRVVWVCDENTSSLALVAIFSAPILHIFLIPHAQAFNLGYSYQSHSDVPTIFVRLLIQIIGELVVGVCASWVKETRGIPSVTGFFSCISSYSTVLIWSCSGAKAATYVLFGLVRHANVFFCSSPITCECLSLSPIREFYNASCFGRGNITTYQDDKLFDGVDASIFAIAIFTGIGMMLVLGISVLITRNRRERKLSTT